MTVSRRAGGKRQRQSIHSHAVPLFPHNLFDEMGVASDSVSMYFIPMTVVLFQCVNERVETADFCLRARGTSAIVSMAGRRVRTVQV